MREYIIETVHRLLQISIQNEPLKVLTSILVGTMLGLLNPLWLSMGKIFKNLLELGV